MLDIHNRCNDEATIRSTDCGGSGSRRCRHPPAVPRGRDGGDLLAYGDDRPRDPRGGRGSALEVPGRAGEGRTDAEDRGIRYLLLLAPHHRLPRDPLLGGLPRPLRPHRRERAALRHPADGALRTALPVVPLPAGGRGVKGDGG